MQCLYVWTYADVFQRQCILQMHTTHIHNALIRLACHVLWRMSSSTCDVTRLGLAHRGGRLWAVMGCSCGSWKLLKLRCFCGFWYLLTSSDVQCNFRCNLVYPSMCWFQVSRISKSLRQIHDFLSDLSLENVLLASKKAGNQSVIHMLPDSYKKSGLFSESLQGGPIYLIDYSMATTQRFHTGWRIWWGVRTKTGFTCESEVWNMICTQVSPLWLWIQHLYVKTGLCPDSVCLFAHFVASLIRSFEIL